MYIDDEQHEPEKETKLEAISLQFVDEALNNIGSEEEAEEQLARDRAQWLLELDTCHRAICQLAGLFLLAFSMMQSKSLSKTNPWSHNCWNEHPFGAPVGLLHCQELTTL